MDDNVSSIKKLEEISKGIVKPIDSPIKTEEGNIVVDGKKISNKFLKIFITKLEEQKELAGMSYEEMLENFRGKEAE